MTRLWCLPSPASVQCAVLLFAVLALCTTSSAQAIPPHTSPSFALELERTYFAEAGTLDQLSDPPTQIVLGPITVRCPGDTRKGCLIEVTMFASVTGTSQEPATWGLSVGIDNSGTGTPLGWTSAAASPDTRMWVVWFTDLAPGAHQVQLAAFKEGAGTAHMVQRSMIVRVYDEPAMTTDGPTTTTTNTTTKNSKWRSATGYRPSEIVR